MTGERCESRYKAGEWGREDRGELLREKLSSGSSMMTLSGVGPASVQEGKTMSPVEVV